MSVWNFARLVPATSGALIALACSGTDPLANASAPTGPADPPNALTFSPCDITTNQGLRRAAAECAELEVPVRRDSDDGQRITLAIKRYKRVAEPRGQLWLLAGGPGSAATDWEMDANFYLDLAQDLELYFMDHRGAGRSNRLACSAEEAPTSSAGARIDGSEWDNCALGLKQRWGDGLGGFNTSEAARDLGESIARTRRAGKSVFLYAVSYGTYLAERYLQLYPTQSTGLVLDSICSPGKCDLLLAYDRQFDATAQTIFQYCAADATCASELGNDPWSHVVRLSAALAEGHCPELGWSSTTLRQVLGFMVDTARLRDYMPAVVRRAERCSVNDVAALEQFKTFVSSIDTEGSSFSQALFANIALSELSSQPPPTAAEVSANVAGLYASVDTGMRLASAIAGWPRYSRDEFYGVFGPTDVPLLMLNGSLDPATPLDVARPAGDFYRGAHQHFVEVPNSPHTTLTQSIMDDNDNTCGAELIRQFLEDPTAAIDTGCTTRVLPMRFAGYASITQLLFGNDSAWDDSPRATAADPPAPSTAAWRGLRRSSGLFLPE